LQGLVGPVEALAARLNPWLIAADVAMDIPL
jgi:hypothetical protein